MIHESQDSKTIVHVHSYESLIVTYPVTEIIPPAISENEATALPESQSNNQLSWMLVNIHGCRREQEACRLFLPLQVFTRKV
jgi:hypothetical protein